MRFLKIPIVIFVIFYGAIAGAQVVDSSFYNFKVYEYNDDQDQKECYIVTYPIDSKSDHNQRQKPYLMITRYQDSRSEEVSIYGGFEYKLNSKIIVLIDDQEFELPTKSDMAWAADTNQDVAIIQKLLNSAQVRVRSDSSIATFAIDEYNLKGITRAYSRMRQICN